MSTRAAKRRRTAVESAPYDFFCNAPIDVVQQVLYLLPPADFIRFLYRVRRSCPIGQPVPVRLTEAFWRQKILRDFPSQVTDLVPMQRVIGLSNYRRAFKLSIRRNEQRRAYLGNETSSIPFNNVNREQACQSLEAGDASIIPGIDPSQEDPFPIDGRSVANLNIELDREGVQLDPTYYAVRVIYRRRTYPDMCIARWAYVMHLKDRPDRIYVTGFPQFVWFDVGDEGVDALFRSGQNAWRRFLDAEINPDIQ